MSSSSLSFLVSLGAVGVYGYSMYTLSTPKVKDGFSDMIPKPLQSYGIFKFLTIQCLLIQIVSSLLHVLAHFVKPLRGLRDLVFTTLAMPVGSIVVYSFWLVWFGMGRELIFPTKLDSFYPPWLNHCTHTILVPFNLLLSLTLRHKFYKNGVLLTLFYLLGYVAFLHVIRAQTGMFVYGYLNELKDTERLVYFGATGVFVYILYKSGQFVEAWFMGANKRAHRRGAPPRRDTSRGRCWFRFYFWPSWAHNNTLISTTITSH